MSTNLIPKIVKNQKKLDSILKSKLLAKTSEDKYNDEDFFAVINKAKQDMYDAQNFFDNVTEPQLIDHAIYKIEAAKTKYTFLLKKAKDKGIRVEI